MKKSQRNAKNRRNRVKKSPVEIGDEYEVNIIESAPNGAGIARVKGFLIFVDDAKPGNKIKIVITNTSPLNAEAKIVA